MNPIYLDNNAPTRPDPRVVEAMLPLYTANWGDASSGHAFGRPVRQQVAAARRSMASLLGIDPGELIITGSGTESDNLAIRGIVLAARAPRHVVLSAVEHPAVLETCKDLESQGLCTLSIVGVNSHGLLDLPQLESVLRPGETCLVCAMWANNETGVVSPIAEIGRLAHAAGARLFVDGVQIIGKLDFDLDRVAVDLLALTAHKFHGPKGIGALVVRKGVQLHPSMTGGGQERGLRSGTENPAGIVGMARAMELAIASRSEAAARMGELRDELQSMLLERVAGLQVSGAGAPRLPNTLHVTIDGIEAESLLVLLDQEGIACSAGSACSTGAHAASHVLLAMGIPASRALGAIRLSLSRESTREEILRVAELLPRMVEKLRSVV